MKKKRAAIYYHNHIRNDGPPLYYFNVLKNQLKLDTLHLLPEGDTRRWGKFDYHFWVDYGEDSFLPKKACMWMPPKNGGKTIYVASDAHLDNGYRFEKAKQFDYVFFNQKHYIDEYLGRPGFPIQEVAYLPHAAEPKAYPNTPTIKKYDLAFIGHVQEEHKGNGVNVTRVEALDRMFREFPNFYYGSRLPMWPEKNMFEDAARHFCESRIVFNISVGNDVNMRFFETLSTGSFLLTNVIYELDNLRELGLVDGVHYVSYGSLDDAVAKAKYYLKHEKEREKIATAGYKAFSQGHTYKHRVEEILKIVG